MNMPNINPDQILQMLGMNKGNLNLMKQNVIHSAVYNGVQLLYKEFPKEDKNLLFIKDPRRSDKEKAIVTLITKALPAFVSKLNETDVSMVFDSIQKLED